MSSSNTLIKELEIVMSQLRVASNIYTFLRTGISAHDEVALQTVQNRLFLMLERKGSEGVNLREAMMETGANPHLVRKMLDQIARPFGAAGRTIWILQNQYSSF